MADAIKDEGLPRRLFKSLTRFFGGPGGMSGVLLLLTIVFIVFNPSFLSKENIFNTLRSSAILGIISTGMLVVILTGNIDLSVGSIAAFCGVAAAFFVRSGLPNVAGIILAVLTGGAIGFLFGFISGVLNLHTLLTTLGGMYIVRGALYQITQGHAVVGLRDTFGVFGNGYLLGIPIPIYTMFSIFIVASIFLSRTSFGRKIYAYGANPEAATYCGFSSVWVKTSALTISGFCSGLGGVVVASRLMSGQPNVLMSINLEAIAAVCLGGATLAGGSGSIIGTIIGVLLLGILRNGLNLLRISPYWQMILTGLIIVVVLALDYLRSERGK